MQGHYQLSGSAGVKYQSKSGSSGTASVQGNPYSDSNGITFSGSGDLDNGMTVGYSYTMTDAAFSTSNVTLDMGDSGKLAFGHESKGGIDTIKDRMPTAGEEAWDDHGTGDDAGVTDLGADPSLYYKVTMWVEASASYSRTGVGTDSSIALVASELVDGATFGIGTGTNVTGTSGTEDDLMTVFATYASGPMTFGVQLSEIDKTAANSDIDREAAAISFAVNENLSISYGLSNVEYEDTSKVDAESTGISASYTMGGITIGAVNNKTDSFGGTSGTDREFLKFHYHLRFN